MKKLKEFFDETLPYLWGVCWVIIITFGSFGLAMKLIMWVLRLMGVL